MPWSVKDVDEKKKGLTPEQKKRWVSIANSALKTCIAKGGSESTCDASAIKIANSKCTGSQSEIDAYINSIALVNFSSSISVEEFKKIETQQTDEGLLIKGLPVFKAGSYRGIEYSTDYIDRNFVNQFKEEDDIPVQADHSPSVFSTLGYVKGLARKAKIMYADFLLKDDNAIARWKKGLMKKFSISVDLIKDRLREISIVAFPYVKAARIHGEGTEEVETLTKDELTPIEINGTYFVNIGDEQFKIARNEENLWFLFPISTRDGEGNIIQEESVSISDEDIDNIDIDEDVLNDADLGDSYKCSCVKCGHKETYSDHCIKHKCSKCGGQMRRVGRPGPGQQGEEFSDEDFAKWTTKYKNSLPDSSFLLIRRPVRDKPRDRALPIRDESGKISRSHVLNALERVNQVKGFGTSVITEAKSRLLRISNKLGMTVKNKLSEELKMTLDQLKKIDLSKLEGEGAEVLKEAIEQITTLEKDRDESTQKLADAIKKNVDLSQEVKKGVVKAKVNELKEAGKITPAQENEVEAFMLTLSGEKLDGFVKLLSSGTPKVDLNETGKETTGKEEPKDALDVESMSAAGINVVAEKLAKDENISFEEALDACYDGKVNKEGKLIKK